MPRLTFANPKYRKHRASGQAVVTLNGVDHYLGPHGTAASRREYDRLIATWLANGRTLQTPKSDITVVELLVLFRRHALQHYRKDGKPTGEVHNFDFAMVPLRLLYGREPVRDFGPLKLQAIQSALASGYSDPRRGNVAGVSRGVVNARIGRIKRIFKWAVSQELAPPSLAHALDTVRGLQRGRTGARETAPVAPVEDSVVVATLPHLPLVVADVVRFQRLTGCRPGEACAIRPCDVDRSGEIWVYRPASHKTEHHGHARTIYIGPQAQQVLLPYLLREADARCFSPADSERKRRAQQRAARRTRVQPSQANRRQQNPMRRIGAAYNKDAYASAIARACDKAGVMRWSPNRLRHTAATEIRKRFGLEAAQIILGHSRADVTQIYAERDEARGLEVVKAIG